MPVLERESQLDFLRRQSAVQVADNSQLPAGNSTPCA